MRLQAVEVAVEDAALRAAAGAHAPVGEEHAAVAVAAEGRVVEGQDPLTGAARLTFGSATLTAGVEFISVIVGLFAISEVMINVEQRITAIDRSAHTAISLSRW